MSIHDELERIAARAPEVAVPPGTWGRAQRARRRERYGVLAAVVVLVALAGTLAWLPTRDDGVDPARSDGLGVPDRLEDVPERLARTDADGVGWESEEVTDDVTAVGRGAAAWLAGRGLPVVVDATRGGYHLLDLPDFLGNRVGNLRTTDPAVALSPDGRRLAYAYAEVGPAAETEPVPSGVRVVDLASGKLRSIPVLGEEGTAVSRIAWSPDGRWLAFVGQQQSWWTENGMGVSRYLDRAGPVLGRIGPAEDRAEIRPISMDVGGLSVDDAGEVTFGYGPARSWDGTRTTRAVGIDEASPEHLGTLPDGSRLRLRAEDRAAILLVSPGGAERRPIIAIDADVGYSLSLATGLIDPDRPTVERPEPDWPTDREHVAMIGAWVLAGLAALALLVATIRLRARRSPYATPMAARPRPRRSK